MKVGDRVWVEKYHVSGTIREAEEWASLLIEPDDDGTWFRVYRNEVRVLDGSQEEN